MKVSTKQLQLLKQYGFQWFKNNSTDRVESSGIVDVIPAAEGFTVIYDATAVFDMSTAQVERIEIPNDLEKEWIRVHWVNIIDQRRDGR